MEGGLRADFFSDVCAMEFDGAPADTKNLSGLLTVSASTLRSRAVSNDKSGTDAWCSFSIFCAASFSSAAMNSQQPFRLAAVN
jgi:hypothetical protein